MLSRRDFLQVALAAAAMPGGLPTARAAARQSLGQDDLLAFEGLGQVTLLHVSDLHAQLTPLYYREPAVALGTGEAAGRPPHLTGKAFLEHHGIPADSPEAYMLTSHNFAALAQAYGRVGGVDRLATLIGAIRAERPSHTLLLDGGDTWQGSLTALRRRGRDMVEVMNAVGVDAMTAHWEFTYGTDRVRELTEIMAFPLLAGNVRDVAWDRELFPASATFERGGVNIVVIGQAFPFTPVANPRHLVPNLSFGIREEQLRQRVAEARRDGADLVVVLSHGGFELDRKLASRVEGIDVLLSGHSHDALPQPVKVGDTLLVASGSHGKFLARLDLDVRRRRIADYRFKLIPVFADVITPDPNVADLIRDLRAPHEGDLQRVLGETESLLYRRGTFNGTFDDLICRALMSERDAEIALSPGFRWGGTLLPGHEITAEHVYDMTAITYPEAYRRSMTGAALKEVLENAADTVWNADPYYRHGGDMVRVGGLAYRIEIDREYGERISGMTLLRSGSRVEPDQSYVVAGWGSVDEGVEGPPVYDVVSRYIESHGVIRIPENQHVEVVG